MPFAFGGGADCIGTIITPRIIITCVDTADCSLSAICISCGAEFIAQMQKLSQSEPADALAACRRPSRTSHPCATA